MGVKYISEYENNEGVQFKIEILHSDYVGIPIEIPGYARLEYASVKDVLECLRGSALALDLEANQNLTLTDLYTETETDFKANLYINNQVKFKGFVKPDGLYTDFVNEVYTISLDCVDGLGILKNLSFVDENGLHFVGYMTEKDIVYNCLKRTSLNLPINISIDIFYDGITDEDNTDILAVTKLSADRFYKDDNKDTIMDCEEVLKSVLEKYCAIIHQHDGEWWIYRPMNAVKTQNLSFFRYDDNVFTGKVSKSLNLVVGSEINGFQPHHCSANQKITIDGSVAAYRVNYKYGVLKTFFQNPKFKPNTDGSIDGWNINTPHYFTINNSDGGLKYVDHTFPDNLEIESNIVSVESGDLLNIALSVENIGVFTGIQFEIELTNGTQTKYFRNGQWGDFDPLNNRQEVNNFYTEYKECPNSGGPPDWENIRYGSGSADFSISIAAVPFKGGLKVRIYTPIIYVTNLNCVDLPNNSYFVLKSFRLEPQDQGNELKKGEFFTVTRIPKPSSIVKDNKTVYNGDMTSDIFEGTIKKIDNSNTSVWHRKGYSEEKPILSIMVEETMRVSAKPSQVFTGDIYGYFDFLKIVNINNVVGNFCPVQYSFDTKSNIVSLTSKELFTDDLDGLITPQDEQKTYDYGNVTKPTIKS
ncbi:hypothetical protein CMU87_18150 [Elizabethkingia anophelis]|nr:hypothetical protein [Elizabethkingia anophelis]